MLEQGENDLAVALNEQDQQLIPVASGSTYSNELQISSNEHFLQQHTVTFWSMQALQAAALWILLGDVSTHEISFTVVISQY